MISPRASARARSRREAVAAIMVCCVWLTWLVYRAASPDASAIPEHDLVHELAGHRLAAEQVADHGATGDAGIGVLSTLEKVHGAAAAKQVAADLVSAGAVGVEAGDGQHGSESVEELACSGDGGLHCGYDTTDQDDRKTSDPTSGTADRGEGVGQVVEHGDRHVGVGVLEGSESSGGHVVSWLTWLV